MKICRIKIDKKKGRGVYAVELIEPYDIIEICELVLVPLEELGHTLSRYVFRYNKKMAAIALGNGCLYNHDKKPNAACYFDFGKKKLVLQAKKTISPHEEILINYGYTKAEQKLYNIS